METSFLLSQESILILQTGEDRTVQCQKGYNQKMQSWKAQSLDEI